MKEPSDAFIHLDDFSEESEDENDLYKVKGLAEYLIELNKEENIDKYLKYFDWWKRDFTHDQSLNFASMKDYSENFGWCKLCKIANEIKNTNSSLEKQKIKDKYFKRRNLHKWWYGDN